MVHGCAGGLHHENVPATHVLTNFNHNFTVTEGLNYCLTLGNLKMLADLSRQLRIGIAAKKFQSVQYHKKTKIPGGVILFSPAGQLTRGVQSMCHKAGNIVSTAEQIMGGTSLSL